MSVRRLLILVSILAIGLFIWQLPTLLKAIPSRYVAAYLPQPVQSLAAREHVETLPTAAVVMDSSELLADDKSDLDDHSLVESPTREFGTESDSETSPSNGPPIELTPGLDSDPESSEIGAAAVEPTTLPSPTPTETPVPVPPAGRLETIRHHFQTWNNCGPATLAMGLSYFDVFLTQEETASSLKPNPEDRNVSPSEMAAFVNQETDLLAFDRTNGNLHILKRLISEGIPVIVELGLDPPGEYRWMGWYGHYLLVVAYDEAGQKFWVYDSWFGTSEVPGENADKEGREIAYADLDRYWKQFNRDYIVLYDPAQESTVAEIIGADMDDKVMWQRSLDRVKDELQTSPDDPFLWFNLGTVYNALDNHEKAAAAFDQAREIGLPWRMLWYQFGPYVAYYEVGRYQDVILLAEVTLKDRPYFEEAYYYKGLAEAASGNQKQAREDFEKAARFNPNFTLAVSAIEQMDT
jgi:tetratricopeptide (TPR) repeat protein